ncbi:unnamed protein product [Meloidogyne enterolobii]|uniref:Uncharacterized protein n=1 Tax=Meloidogyne enterolobii TaxID=390850 RepID=A0ACB0ZE33_MELEN
MSILKIIFKNFFLNFQVKIQDYKMVSIKSSTWAILLIQLVISCIAIISSVALFVAQAQSLDLNGLAMGPTLHSIFVCFLSFSLLGR